MARTRLLKGAIPTPRRNHGITKHFEKAGGQSAMTKDFYVVQPTKVSDAVVSKTTLLFSLLKYRMPW